MMPTTLETSPRASLAAKTYYPSGVPMETYDALLASITPAPGQDRRTIFDPATGEAVGDAPVHTVEDPASYTHIRAHETLSLIS
ncbi:hypothetical protein, partial [Paenarthrobacter nicotinovorans]|uniref:hypothetical protein n=1 Tax=Paenarthrobacter nicotinovorans TaxID=29320 RepID=UPI0024869B30